ncbi:DUF1624 domain-containing protein [Sphingomonas nostoxanthinifaciens]|uniref:DUF1624 domain-containing protein n=1 Tax=Sphingomonas nostoxanthinifaciens TaxID=2872652 RepID=UPI001CC1EE36|nr:heparan-alpha-glucosaminide N-acetyltransferase domain-containing protein [Sphingomonas nostoxanthinifaciens]UAK24957.1 heparan-alpha-glucosaminide N-acetyltransferase domain-containing protein [Sphingomonas nostoxanthinifaciens]
MATAIPNIVRDPLVEPVPAGLTRAGAARLDAIDMLRGLVIVVMVLDHVRDFFHVAANSFDPTDPLRTTPILFATRWVTHLCAPTFVFLAGVSIFFQKANGKSPAALTRFLLTRGAWLVLLECTVISFGFNLGPPFLFLQVMWAIGMSMICMGLIARAPAPAVLAIGIAILLLYSFMVPLTAGVSGALGLVRMATIAPGKVPGAPILIFYAFVPWLAVMCIGFGLGPIYRLAPAVRRQRLLPIALGLLVAFALLRLLDGYGDPAPWVHLATPVQTGMSFMNVSKYPPSPDYVCATLGISILLFLALERLRGPAARILLDFGRTPLFTYICHIYIAHGIMLVVAAAMGMPRVAFDVVAAGFSGMPPPAGWGFSLGIVYLVWLAVVVALIPLARWFAGVKRRRRDWWLGYL